MVLSSLTTLLPLKQWRHQRCTNGGDDILKTITKDTLHGVGVVTMVAMNLVVVTILWCCRRSNADVGGVMMAAMASCRFNKGGVVVVAMPAYCNNESKGVVLS